MSLILDMLQVAFVILKILGVIDWAWGVVFIPVYALALLFIVKVVVHTWLELHGGSK